MKILEISTVELEDNQVLNITYQGSDKAIHSIIINDKEDVNNIVNYDDFVAEEKENMLEEARENSLLDLEEWLEENDFELDEDEDEIVYTDGNDIYDENEIEDMYQDYVDNNADEEDFDIDEDEIPTIEDLAISAIEKENKAIALQHTIKNLSDGFISANIKIINDRYIEVHGQKVNDVLAEHLVQLLKQKNEDPDSVDKEDWMALIHFTELLYSNVNTYVRDQLWLWLKYQITNGRLVLTPEGHFLGYKGCMRDKEGNIVSINAGPGIVNGEVTQGHLENNPGNIVEISRDYVDADPTQTCSRGLHVGSYDYAKGFANTDVMLVDVNPMDVVSVPYDYDGQKIRTCKYKVIKAVQAELSEFTYDDSADYDDEEDD